MNTAVTVQQPVSTHVATAQEIKAQVQRIQQVMRSVMKENVHFGKIPGTPKPSLWKPGAEILCATFRIAPSFQIEDLSDDRRVRYRVKCVGTHQGTGIVLGEGMGSASSDEEKYQWRDAVCEAEFDEAFEDSRRAKWQKGQNGGEPYKRLQIRTDPANAENTVLKMACKRAQVAMTINVTAASDIFSQDLEDIEGVATDVTGDKGRGKPSTQAPRSNRPGGSGKFATDAQVRLLRTKLDQAGMSAEDLCKRYEIKSITDLPFDKVNDALAFIADPEREAIEQEAANAP